MARDLVRWSGSGSPGSSGATYGTGMGFPPLPFRGERPDRRSEVLGQSSRYDPAAWRAAVPDAEELWPDLLDTLTTSVRSTKTPTPAPRVEVGRILAGCHSERTLVDPQRLPSRRRLGSGDVSPGSHAEPAVAECGQCG